MAAPDALLDALRVPRQVVVDHHRAELQIDAFRRCLGGDHDRSMFAEVVHQSRTDIGGARAGYAVSTFVPLDPGRINLLGALVGVAAVEQDELVAVAVLG